MKTTLMLMFEMAHGLTIEQLIAKRFNEGASVEKFAPRYNLKPTTLREWERSLRDHMNVVVTLDREAVASR
jgi:transposase-like protein